MIALPHLQEIFALLRRGWHLSPEDEPLFSAVAMQPEAYVDYFAPIGIKLVRHPRDFFYFNPEPVEKVSDVLPRIAVFSFILIDHAANLGRSIEEYIFGQHFLVSKLPHFDLDRYAAMLRQVEVVDLDGLHQVLKNMERIGWIKFVDLDTFRVLRPFHRMLDKCLELAASGDATLTTEPPSF